MRKILRNTVKRIIPTGLRMKIRTAQSAIFVQGWPNLLIRRVLHTGSLPDFIIIGAQKTGTTSLFFYLARHPQIHPPVKKEIHFFDTHYFKGIEWYQRRFPSAMYHHLSQKILKTTFLTGEATPSYLHHPHAARRAAESVPAAKLIVILRNPIDRAYSQFNMACRGGSERRSFEEAIDGEIERLALEREKMLGDEHYFSFEYQRRSYLTRGLYAKHLELWFRYFPRSQFLFLSSDDFQSNPAGVLHQTLEFLELHPIDLREYKVHKEGGYAPMADSCRANLVEFFRPHNRRLYEMIGREFEWDG